MADLGGFDANNVKPNEGFEVIPAGEYDAAIIESTAETTKSGKFRVLKLKWQILNGPFQNRTLFDRLNIAKMPNYNSEWGSGDEKALTIGKGNLSAICRAVNVLTPKDSTELHGCGVRIKVKIRKSDEYGDQNEIASYKPRNAGPAGPTLPGMATTPVAPQPASGPIESPF